jgi:helicase MOV-10
MTRGRAYQPHYCRACQCPVEFDVWEQHIVGRKHLQQAQNLNTEPTAIFPTETHTFCSICQISILNHLWSEHLCSVRHKRSQRYTVFKSAQDDAEKDKNGVVVDGDSDFGILEPTVGASGVTASLRISCTVPLAKIVMVSAKLSADLGSQRGRVVSP